MVTWQVGEEYLVQITGLSHEGAGVGRVGERVVFIPEAIPGDSIRMRLVHVKQRLAFGEIIEILEPSPERISPSCAHAELCGGCQLQHMDYGAQLRWKRQQVQDAIERIGKLNVEVLSVKGMDSPLHYRNKSQLPFGLQGQEMVMGFFQKGSHDIVELSNCEIQHPLITKLALTLKGLAAKLGIEPYDEKNHQGVLRHAVIRVSFSKETIMLILVTRTSEFKAKDELIAELRQAVPELVSIAQNVNPSVTNVIMGRETKILWGDAYLLDSIGHLNYAISPGSFFQVNPFQTKVLYDLVRERMPATGQETILDLYCGAGTIGLYLAENVNKVIGVETFPAAVEDARFNTALNGIKNAEFHVGKAEEQVPRLLKKLKKIDGVVLDPPRKGCETSLLDTIVKANVPTIVYVSCNPSTLARDLSYLAERGYRVGAIQPVDMFPWTRHVETVVLMSRVDK